MMEEKRGGEGGKEEALLRLRTFPFYLLLTFIGVEYGRVNIKRIRVRKETGGQKKKGEKGEKETGCSTLSTSSSKKIASGWKQKKKSDVRRKRK